MLNTRPIPQDQLNNEIIALGGKVTSMPLLSIKPLLNNWQDNLKPIDYYDIAIFISKNAVDCFFDIYSQQLDFQRGASRWPSSILTIAIGKATDARLSDKNIKTIKHNADTSENLLEIPELQNVTQKKILLIKGVGGRDVLQNTLTKRGAIVNCVEVYERIKTLFSRLGLGPTKTTEDERACNKDDSIDIILLTSSEAIEHLFALFADLHEWIQKKTCVVISQRLAKIARAKGIKKVFVTPPDKILQGLIGASYTINTNN